MEIQLRAGGGPGCGTRKRGGGVSRRALLHDGGLLEVQISFRLTIDRVSFFGSSSLSAGHTLLIGETIRVPPPFSLFGCTTYTIRAGRNLSASRPCCSSPSHSPGKLIPVCPFVFSPSFSSPLSQFGTFLLLCLFLYLRQWLAESFASSSHSSLSAKLVWNYALREEGG